MFDILLQAVWVQELLDPKVIPRHLLNEAARPHLPLSTAKAFPELSFQIYGQGQWTQFYRGHKVVSHTGGLPGQNSILIRLVDDDFGLMLATNEQALSLSIFVIAYRILDDYLGLPPIDWEGRYVQQWIKQAEAIPRIPKNPKSPTHDVEGLYHHPVYGDINLVKLDIVRNGFEQHVETALQHQLREYNNAVYYAPYNKVFSTHIALTHFSGNAYNWTTMLLKASLKPDSSRSSSEYGAPIVQAGSAYIDEKGIGMFGNFWGAGEEIPVVHAAEDMSDVEARAEVWFARR